VARYWADLVREEFFAQGDAEKELKLSISPFMDRSNSAPLPKTQTGFIDFIVLPLYNVLRKLLPDAAVCCDTLVQNRQKWQNLVDQLDNPAEDS